MKQSQFLSLNTRDVLRAALMAAIGAGLGGAIEALQSPTGMSLHTLKAAGTSALIAGLGYLLKNLFTPPDKPQ